MYHTFNFIDHLDEYSYDDLYVFCSVAGCRLRKHDSALNYTPVGYYEEGTIDLPNISGIAVRDFTGVYVEGYLPEGTSLSYQASVDDGATWQWYDGANWLPAGSGDWSTLAQIDAGVAELEGHQLKLRIRLTPNTAQNETPSIARVHVFYEAVWSYFEDLKRSIKHYIDETAVVYLTWGKSLSAAASSIVIETAWQVIDAFAVYDLTTDPGRTVNLFASYTPGSRTVAFTGTIAAGSNVEIHFKGRCNTFLAADENLQISEVPSIVVIIPRAREDKFAPKNLFDYEPLVSQNVVRRRDRSVPISSTVVIYVLGAIEVDALALQDALAELFEPEGTFKSVAVGEDFFCLTYDPLIDNDIVSTGLHVKATQLLVVGHKELRSYTDLPPARVVYDTYAGAGLVREDRDMVRPLVRVPTEDAVSSNRRLNPFCLKMRPEEGEIDS